MKTKTRLKKIHRADWVRKHVTEYCARDSRDGSLTLIRVRRGKTFRPGEHGFDDADWTRDGRLRA